MQSRFGLRDQENGSCRTYPPEKYRLSSADQQRIFPLAFFQDHFVLRSLITLPHDLGGGMSFYGLQQHFWDFRRFAEAPGAALCSLNGKMSGFKRSDVCGQPYL
ncbi:hypothetical protein ACWHAM_15845 [Paenibacillus terrae]